MFIYKPIYYLNNLSRWLHPEPQQNNIKLGHDTKEFSNIPEPRSLQTWEGSAWESEGKRTLGNTITWKMGEGAEGAEGNAGRYEE